MEGTPTKQTKNRRNPTWSRNELILALDLFMHHPGENLSEDHSDVVELSDFLRRMGELLGWPMPPNFRSPNSVVMRLANFSHLDPSHIDAGLQGLPNGGKECEFVWREFFGFPDRLASEAATIRAEVEAGHINSSSHNSATTTVTSYITRLCQNGSNWQYPTRSAAEASNTFFSRHGYGHEEWLFRFEWQIGGWQYGFLQGVNKGWESRLTRGERAGDVVLYTLTPDGRRYVARIHHIEFLDEAQGIAALDHYKRVGWYDRMLEEIEVVDGDRSGLGNGEWAPYVLNVRFRPEDVEWYPPNTFAKAGDPVQHYNRYQLIELNHEDSLPETVNTRRPARSGQNLPPIQDSYFRSGISGRECSPEHGIMQAALYEELKIEYPEASIVFEEDFVDVTVATEMEKILFEVKSDFCTRRVLRLAIGQLLEYAYYWNELPEKAVRLVAVGRTALSPEDETYLRYLTEKLNLPLEYRQVKLPSEA
ncbi:hypothetical protein ACW9I5_05895 [Pseudomonas azotoformans]